MAFDTPENRHRYEVALGKHDILISERSRNGLSYRRGYNGAKYHCVDDDFEHWCAGRTNKSRHTPTSNTET